MAENEALTWTVSTPGTAESTAALGAMKEQAQGLAAALREAGEAARAALADLRRASRVTLPSGRAGGAGGATRGAGGGSGGASSAKQEAQAEEQAQAGIIRRQLTFNRGLSQAIAAGNREIARQQEERRQAMEAAGRQASSEETRIASDAAKAVREGTALIDRAWKDRQRELQRAARDAERAEAAEAKRGGRDDQANFRQIQGMGRRAGQLLWQVSGGIAGVIGSAFSAVSGIVRTVMAEAESVLSAFGAVAERVGTVVGGTLVAALLATATQGIATEQALQRTTLSLTRIEGSGAGAAAVLREVREAAHNSGMSLLELLGPGRELAQAYGPQGLGRVGDTLRAFRDAALATGAGREGIEKALFSYRELLETPGADQAGRMLRQFDKALPGVNARKIIREQFGTADPELLALAGISGRQIADALIAGLKSRFSGMADDLGRRDIGVAFGNLRTAWELLANSIAGSEGPQVAAAISDLADGIERLGANRQFVSALAVPFQLLGEAIRFARGHLPDFVNWLSSILTRGNVVRVLSETWGYIRAIGDELGRFFTALGGGRKASDFWDAFRNAARGALDYVGKAWQEFLLGVRFLSDNAPLLFGIVGNSIGIVKDSVDGLTASVKELVKELGGIPFLGKGGGSAGGGGGGGGGGDRMPSLSIPGLAPGSGEDTGPAAPPTAPGMPRPRRVQPRFLTGNWGDLKEHIPIWEPWVPVRPDVIREGRFARKEQREIAAHPELYGDANAQEAAKRLRIPMPAYTGTYSAVSPPVEPPPPPRPAGMTPLIPGPAAGGPGGAPPAYGPARNPDERQRQIAAQMQELQRRFDALKAEAGRIWSQPYGGMGGDFTERQRRYAGEADRYMGGKGAPGAGEPPPGVIGGMAPGETPAQARNRERRGIVYPPSPGAGASEGPPVLEMDPTGQDKARVRGTGGTGATRRGGGGMPPRTMIPAGYALPGAGGAGTGGDGGEEDEDQEQLQATIQKQLEARRASYQAAIAEAKVIAEGMRDAGPFATRLQQSWAAARAAAAEVQSTIPALQAEQADIEAEIGRVNPATAYYSQLKQRQAELQGQINEAIRGANRAGAEAVRATAQEARGTLDAQIDTARAAEQNLAQLNPLAAQAAALRDRAPLLRRRIALLGQPVPGESPEEAERRRAEQEQTRGELLQTVLQGGGFGGKAASARTLDGNLLSLINTKRLGQVGEEAEQDLQQAAQYAYPQVQARARMQRAAALTRRFNQLLAPELRSMLGEEARQRATALDVLSGDILPPDEAADYRGNEDELKRRRRLLGRHGDLAGGPLQAAAEASRSGRPGADDLAAYAQPGGLQAKPGESAEDYAARRDAQYAGGGWWRGGGAGVQAPDGTRPLVLNLPVAFGPEQIMAAIWEVIRGMFDQPYPGPSPMQ